VDYLETVMVIVTGPGAALGETLTVTSAFRIPGLKPIPPGFEAAGIARPGWLGGLTVASLEPEVALTVTVRLTLAKFPTSRWTSPDSPANASPVQVATVPLESTEHARGLLPKVPAVKRITRGSLTVRVVVV
jgi:hypothetical protein